MVNELRSPVVLDATVLSNLAVTDDLDLLCALPARFVTVEAVTDELRAGVEAGYGHLDRAIDATDVVHAGITYIEQYGKDVGELVQRIDVTLRRNEGRDLTGEVVYA